MRTIDDVLRELLAARTTHVSRQLLQWHSDVRTVREPDAIALAATAMELLQTWPTARAVLSRRAHVARMRWPMQAAAGDVVMMRGWSVDTGARNGGAVLYAGMVNQLGDCVLSVVIEDRGSA